MESRWTPHGGTQGTHADRERLSGCRAPHHTYVREKSKQQKKLRGVVRGQRKGFMPMEEGAAQQTGAEWAAL